MYTLVSYKYHTYLHTNDIKYFLLQEKDVFLVITLKYNNNNEYCFGFLQPLPSFTQLGISSTKAMTKFNSKIHQTADPNERKTDVLWLRNPSFHS